ncbi:hypothetical protein D3C76_1475200 [compost metagenome]
MAFRYLAIRELLIREVLHIIGSAIRFGCVNRSLNVSLIHFLSVYHNRIPTHLHSITRYSNDTLDEITSFRRDMEYDNLSALWFPDIVQDFIHDDTFTCMEIRLHGRSVHDKRFEQ